MGPYYALLMCGGAGFLLAFIALLQGKELQALFLLFFVVLSALLAIFFKLIEIKSLIEKNNKDKYS